eukprot:scaffold289310_cov31-Tisochrysis_lutea.AAC.2
MRRRSVTLSSGRHSMLSSSTRCCSAEWSWQSTSSSRQSSSGEYIAPNTSHSSSWRSSNSAIGARELAPAARVSARGRPAQRSSHRERSAAAAAPTPDGAKSALFLQGYLDVLLEAAASCACPLRG